MKRIAFFLFLPIFLNTVMVMGQSKPQAGKTTKSKINGSWTSSSTWTNETPDSGQDSIVVDGDSVNSTSVATLIIGSKATLIVKNNGELVANDIEFTNGSKIVIESGSTLTSTNLKNRNNSKDVIVNGTINVSGAFDNGVGGVITGTGTIAASSFSGEGSTFGVNTSEISTPLISGSYLPVELLFFNSNCDNNKKTINWATASESNNSYFVIEISNNAHTFSELTRINGAGNSNIILNYTYTTTEEFKYVRLAQVDFDGTKKIYDTHSTCEISKNGISVCPNPANSVVNIIGANEQSQIQIYNTLGAIVYSQEASNNTSVDVSNFTNGIYTIKIVNADGSVNQFKLLKN